jgi:putative oxidoreductase
VKIAMVIVRTLMGILFLFGSIVYFFNLFPVPEMTGKVKTFNDGMAATGYMMTLIKAVELVCGVLFVSGYAVPFATILIAPVIVNIFLFHLFLDPSTLAVAIFLVFANIFVAYYYRNNYKPLFANA